MAYCLQEVGHAQQTGGSKKTVVGSDKVNPLSQIDIEQDLIFCYFCNSLLIFRYRAWEKLLQDRF